MYQRMRVPLDDSEFAAQAVPAVRFLAKAFGAEVELFQVMPPLIDVVRSTSMATADSGDQLTGTASARSPYEAMQAGYERVQQVALQRLDGIAQTLRAGGLKVSTVLGEGDPAEAIAGEADRTDGTLITMTTHGRSGLGRWRLGSVTDKTIHLTSAPAFVVRCKEGETLQEVQIKRIILPLDGSPLAEEAVPHAIAFARALDVPMEVLQALSVERPVAAGFPGPTDVPSPTRNATPVNAYLDGMVERLRVQGVGRIEGNPVDGDPAKAILSAAENTDGALVVMSTHGRSGLKRMLRGSVADKVVRESGRPVVVVRPQVAET
jgi:nucleotide-binding universal stress UspA family protein